MEGTALVIGGTLSMDEYKSLLAEQDVPAEFRWLIRYLFTEVLDGRNAHVTDGVWRALHWEPRDFRQYAQAAAAAGAWAGPKPGPGKAPRRPSPIAHEQEVEAWGRVRADRQSRLRSPAANSSARGVGAHGPAKGPRRGADPLAEDTAERRLGVVAHGGGHVRESAVALAQQA
jgi:hypothetical protein